MDRRHFLQSTSAVVAGSMLLAPLSGTAGGAMNPASSPSESAQKQESKMKIVVAADPFAVTLKDAIVAHLKEKGHDVTDVGSQVDREIAYFECCPPACQMLQEKKADFAILLCGTGMGMSVVANRFPGVTASCVESVFATKMCRTINNANALCLGAMIWGEWMAKEAVDVFLTTKFTEALPQFADFLRDAAIKVENIRP